MTTFEELRPRLLGIAYRVLGSYADAEDVVQETWIAWQQADRASVSSPAAYLTRAVTNQALNRIRSAQRRREEYVGEWLPEPVATDRLPDEVAEIADSVTFAMLVMLERLSPLERAAFVLREVFDVPTAEVAATLDRSPAAIRQLVARGRAHLGAEARFTVDPAEHHEVSAGFLAAIRAGDVETATRLLSPTVELIADGGGKASSALRPLLGPEHVVRFIAGLIDKYGLDDVRIVHVNRMPAMLIHSDAAGDSVYQLAVRDGRIERIWVTRNPDKMRLVTSRRTE